MLDCRRGYGKYMGWDDQWEHGDRNGDWQMALVDCHVEPCFSKGVFDVGIVCFLSSPVPGPWPVGQRPSSSSESLSSHRNQKRSGISFNARKHAVCYMMLYVYICLRYFVKSVMFCGNLVPWRLDSLDLWIWPLIQSLLVPFAAHGRPKLQPGKSAFHHHMLPSMRWLSRTISCQKITNQLERNLSAELARQCSTIWTSSSQDIAILRMSVAKSVLLHRVCRHFGGLECLEVKMSRR